MWGKWRKEGEERRKAATTLSSPCPNRPTDPEVPSAREAPQHAARPRGNTAKVLPPPMSAPPDWGGQASAPPNRAAPSVHTCLRAAEGGPDPGISATRSCIWHRARLHLQAAHSVCTSHNAELSLLEKDRALFLVLLSTVHFICLLNRSIFVFPGGFSGC